MQTGFLRETKDINSIDVEIATKCRYTPPYSLCPDKLYNFESED